MLNKGEKFHSHKLKDMNHKNSSAHIPFSQAPLHFINELVIKVFLFIIPY